MMDIRVARHIDDLVTCIERGIGELERLVARADTVDDCLRIQSRVHRLVGVIEHLERGALVKAGQCCGGPREKARA